MNKKKLNLKKQLKLNNNYYYDKNESNLSLSYLLYKKNTKITNKPKFLFDDNKINYKLKNNNIIEKNIKNIKKIKSNRKKSILKFTNKKIFLSNSVNRKKVQIDSVIIQLKNELNKKKKSLNFILKKISNNKY